MWPSEGALCPGPGCWVSGGRVLTARILITESGPGLEGQRLRMRGHTTEEHIKGGENNLTILPVNIYIYI